HLHHRPLDEPIQHRRNTRLSYSPVRFRDFHPLHRLRLIGQAIRGFTPIFLSKGQHELVLLPLVAHESRRLLATPINPLRGPFAPSSGIPDQQQISRGKFDRLPHATAGFTTSALDEYALRCQLPTRPAPYASDPVLLHRLARLLHASFRPRLATTPLRFAFELSNMLDTRYKCPLRSASEAG